MNTMRQKNPGTSLVATLLASIVAVAAVHAEEGKGNVPKEFQEAAGILETIPDIEGKSKEEVEAILQANPDIDKKIAEVE